MKSAYEKTKELVNQIENHQDQGRKFTDMENRFIVNSLEEIAQFIERRQMSEDRRKAPRGAYQIYRRVENERVL